VYIIKIPHGGIYKRETSDLNGYGSHDPDREAEQKGLKYGSREKRE
jgi:hypothetical protein